jgi:hypothetical protein
MWVVVLGSKGEAADAIRRAQAVAEAECGSKLRMLCIENGGEFTVAEFTSYYMDEVFSATTPRRTTRSTMASSSGTTRRLWGWLEPSSSRGECLLSSGERWW